MGPRSYIYEYNVRGRHANLSIAGENLTDSLRQEFFKSAAKYKIKQSQITLAEHSFGLSQNEMDAIIAEIYDKTDAELTENQSMIEAMQARIDELSSMVEELRQKTDSLSEEVSLNEYLESPISEPQAPFQP